MVPLNLSVSLSLTNRTLLILSYNKIKIFIILKFVYWKVIEQALQLTSYYLQTVHFLLGSFSIDNGNENVSFKMNSRFFNLCRVYSNLLKMASVGEFPWSWFLEDRTQVWREKKRFVVACLRPP